MELKLAASSSATNSRRLNELGLGSILDVTGPRPWTWPVRGGMVLTGGMMDVDLIKGKDEVECWVLGCGFIGFDVDVDGTTGGMLKIETFGTMKLD